MSEIVAHGRKPATPWKIAVGVFLIAAAASNTSRPSQTGAAEAFGALAAVSIFVFGGIGLIASGLPKNLGNKEFTKARRRRWIKLMLVGFIVTAALTLALAASDLIGLAVVVTWLYWFVWTWASWRYADRKTLEQLRVRPS
jgi:hypothetical protein